MTVITPENEWLGDNRHVIDALQRRGFAPQDIYRVRLWARLAVVYRYKRTADGNIVINRRRDGVRRRLPKVILY